MYICVVFKLECPSSSCMTLRSAPPDSNSVAKECLSECGVMLSGKLRLTLMFCMSFSNVVGEYFLPVLLRNKYLSVL